MRRYLDLSDSLLEMCDMGGLSDAASPECACLLLAAQCFRSRGVVSLLHRISGSQL